MFFFFFFTDQRQRLCWGRPYSQVEYRIKLKWGGVDKGGRGIEG